MRRLQLSFAALLGALLLAAVAPATAVPLAPVAAISSATSAAGVASANAAHRAVSGFRAQSRQDLSGFLTNYGDRLTAEQNERAEALIAKADLTLAQLEAKTRTTRALARSGAIDTRVQQAADAASRAFDTASASTAAALAEMQPLLRSSFHSLKACRPSSCWTNRCAISQRLAQPLNPSGPRSNLASPRPSRANRLTGMAIAPTIVLGDFLIPEISRGDKE